MLASKTNLAKSLLIACTLLFALFMLSPVNANWTMFRADLNRTSVVTDDWSPGEVTWNFSTGASIKSAPAISNGVVYITSYDE